MKKFYVMLTYMSLKQPMRIVVMAVDADEARSKALAENPNAKIEGPSAVMEKKEFA